MSRYNHHIYKVYIADGFATDCDELIHRCLQLSKLDYQEFCKIWKDLDFSMIFHGRNSGAEIAELSEELVYISKQYLLKNTENFEESVAGLFLLYGVLTLQPYTNFAWLRLTPDDIPAIKRIELVARQDRRLDLLYILGEILIKYTQYHAVERERGMESVLRKYLDGYTSIDKLGVRPKGVFYRQNEELDIIRDLGTVSRQYTKAKDMLRVAGRPDPSLQYINENLPFELNVTLKKIINGAIDDDCDDSPDEHYNMVQAIKTRAVTNTVDNMRHLTAVEDRISTQENSSPRTSKQGKSDLKTPTGRVKSGSPTKRMTSSPGKRKLDVKSVRKKKICVENTKRDSGSADIDVEDFHKAAAKVIAEGAEGGITHTKETDIHIDPTAVVLGKDVAKNLEIEFIDVGNLSVDGNGDNESGRDTDSTSDTNRTAIKTKIKKPEKRELKRLHLKSKFKRLGMLPVANFNDKNGDLDNNTDQIGN